MISWEDFTIAVLAVGFSCLTVGVILGAVIQLGVIDHRRARRRHRIDVHGHDALESWLAGVELQWQPNGTPFEDEPV
jgi:hypothetical protein